jgi:NitT/TauT family transport system ATP-binding protein
MNVMLPSTKTLVDDVAASEPILDIRDVTLQYTAGHLSILATYKVSAQVFEADRFVLLGPSGCGKSTLLKAIGGFHKPSEGEIRLRGRKVTQPGPDRMMVFQEFDQLLPWKTVVQNVMFPLIESGKAKSRKEAEERARYYLDKVNLTKFADNYPHMLSGGMKQRVAIARGMAMEPDILLMDEPFAALDALTRVKMQDELLELWDDTHFTVLFVTHSIAEAIKIGNRILLLSPHPGQVKAELNGLCRADAAGPKGKALERDIHHMLFADKASDEERPHG